MRNGALASSVALLALVASPANAQSLSDAINSALAPNTAGDNCAALGAGVSRVTDTWQWIDNSPLPDTIRVTNGDTGSRLSFHPSSLAGMEDFCLKVYITDSCDGEMYGI